MPKERIYTHGTNDVTVGWDPHGVFDGPGVQVGVGPADAEDFSPAAVWANLNRTSVNRLIQMLRKARDRSFGQDA